MFRLTALLPVLFSIAALVLSILVLLAGRNPGFLPDVFILKVLLPHPADSGSC